MKTEIRKEPECILGLWEELVELRTLKDVVYEMLQVIDIKALGEALEDVADTLQVEIDEYGNITRDKAEDL